MDDITLKALGLTTAMLSLCCLAGFVNLLGAFVPADFGALVRGAQIHDAWLDTIP